ncbi:DUF362 domain-containing protein [Guggenheimella bovis]
MKNVYFIPMKDWNPEKISVEAKRILDHLVTKENVVLEKEVPLKVHFGEQGNVTFIPPTCYLGVIDYLKEKHVDTRFIETNVLYRGSRTTRDKHLETARSHGFTMLPITIADGDHGEEYDNVAIDGELLKSVKIGKGYAPYKQFIVLAHFKGHVEAGFGGAMKQLGMGFAARGGKLEQHATIKPFVNEDVCVSCGICKGACNYDAIEIVEKASIDSSKCVGCAGCVAACPTGAIETEWSQKDFYEKLAEYAYGAQKGRNNIYLNFAFQITNVCDCVGKELETVADNIGILASTDPVALDTACLTLLQEREGKLLFDKGRRTIEHAEKIGLGTSEYNLITLE